MITNVNYNALTFTILQWNILCLEFCDNISFPKANKQHLDWSYRKERFKDIFKLNKSDLICLEEVDDYKEFEGIINSIDVKYKHIYERKKQGTQGISLFYNSSVFSLIKYKKKEFYDSNQFFLVVFLKNLSNNINIVLIITHLKAKIENEFIRIEQMKQIIKYLNSESFYNDYQIKYKCKGFIITGDFNADPDSMTINNFKKFYLLNKHQIINAFKDVEFTTFKFRDKAYLRTIDYLFFSHRLEIISSNEFPKLKDLMPYGLPSKNIPSDHLFLSAKFRFY